MPLLTLCMEGTKGAGKSTTTEKVTQSLRQSGFEVVICAPFTAANDFAQLRGYKGAREMISHSAQENKVEIDFILSTIDAAREAASQKASESKTPVVLVYDRGWMTILPHLFGGRWCHEEGRDSADIQKIWAEVLNSAPPTIFFHASFEITKQRRSHLDYKSGLETDDKLRQDIEQRTAFANQHADKIVMSFDTGTIPQDEVVTQITHYVRSTLEKTRGPAPAP